MTLCNSIKYLNLTLVTQTPHGQTRSIFRAETIKLGTRLQSMCKIFSEGCVRAQVG